MRILAAAFCVVVLLNQDARTAIQGTWAVTEYDQNGQKPEPAVLRSMEVVIGADKITIRPKLVVEYKPFFKNGKSEKEAFFRAEEGKADEIKFRLNADKGWIDLGEGKQSRGIYLLEGDTLRICFAVAHKKRPKKFPEQPKNGVVRMVLKKDGQRE